MRGDLLGHRLRRADRHRDDDEIGTFDRFRSRRDVMRAELEFLGTLQRLFAARGNDDLVGEAQLLDVARDRRADQTDADQRNPVKMHARFTATHCLFVLGLWAWIFRSGLIVS